MEVVTIGSEQSGVNAHEAQIVGDIPAHAAKADAYPTGIGVSTHKGRGAFSTDIHIDAAHHHDIAAGAKYIASAGDAAFFRQVGNMHGHTGAGDAQPLGDVLLRDQWVRFNQLQYLPLPLCHAAAS